MLNTLGLTVFGEVPRAGCCSCKETRWGRTEERYHLGQMSSTAISVLVPIMTRKQRFAFEQIPNLCILFEYGQSIEFIPAGIDRKRKSELTIQPTFHISTLQSQGAFKITSGAR